MKRQIKVQVGEPRDGGHEYKVMVPGVPIVGWFLGTRKQTAAYAKKVAEKIKGRTEGLKFYNGRQR